MFSLQYSTHTTQLLGWKEVANRFHELSGSDTWKPRSDSHTESQTGYVMQQLHSLICTPRFPGPTKMQRKCS